MGAIRVSMGQKKNLRHGFGLKKKHKSMQLLRSWLCICALIIMNHMYVVLLGSILGKAKGQISLMQNLDQNIESWLNFYVRRGKAKF